ADVLRAARAVLAELVAKRRMLRAVDGIAVDFQPAPDSAQDVLARLRNDAFSCRSDVQQVVPALTDDVDELERDLSRRFPVRVVGAETPGVIDRCRRLPCFSGRLRRNDVVD